MDFNNHTNGLSSNNQFNDGNGKSSSSTYQNVIHKKQNGTLILNEDGYTFYPIRGGGGGGEDHGQNVGGNGANGSTRQPIKQSWMQVTKHQVSPVSHARHLLKIILQSKSKDVAPSATAAATIAASTQTKTKSISVMFELKTRDEIEKIRKDVSHRLFTTRKIHSLNHDQITSSSSSTATTATGSRKRSLDEMKLGTHSSSNGSPNHSNYFDDATTSTSTYTHLTKSQSKVASSSLLASYPTLRTQNTLLTQHPSEQQSKHDENDQNNHNSNQTHLNSNSSSTSEPIISKNHDFWSTHSIQQSNQFSKIIGITSRGLPSTIKSSLEIQLTNTASSSATSGKSKDSKSSSNKDSSTQSSLTGNAAGNAITLGVEEMKQIFIMYPAVHAAYEEKVPLELSEELFWRKYLESEYFHRDRGKLGMSARTNLMEVSGGANASSNSQKKGDDDDDGDDGNGPGGDGEKDDNDAAGNDKKEDTKKVDESVRVATASSNDIFSRKEMELKQIQEKEKAELEEDEEYQRQLRLAKLRKQTSDKSIAIGQFDLTSTANTERGSKLLLNTKGDIFPSNDCGKKVIEKYNKHWAMVLNPKEAVAGCDLSSLARKSVTIALDGDNDANAKGGNDEEMQRLVHSAAASSCQDGSDDHYHYGDNVLFEELSLKNINAYSGQFARGNRSEDSDSTPIEKQLEIDVAFSKVAMGQVKTLVEPIISSAASSQDTDQKVDGALPDKKFGMQLLMALTKKLVEDSKTEKDAARMTNELSQDFRKQFTKYFRRSSELLRHFYALRRLMETEQKKTSKNNDPEKNGKEKKQQQLSQKLDRIATGLEDVYREMEGMKNVLPSSDLGERMRKMFIPIMDQLDWASKLHKDGLTSNSGPKKTGGFGFVDVD